MKAFGLKQDSLHYKLAKLGGFDNWSNQDICTYTRRVLVGVLMSLLVVGLFTFVATGIVELVLSIWFSLYYSTNMFSEPAIAAVLVIGTAVFVFGLFSFFQYLEKSKYESCEKKPDGFIKTAYKSHKEKYCVRIEFE